MQDAITILRGVREKLVDALIFLIELPIIAAALIGAGLLHGAMTALEWLDPLTPEKEEE